MGLPGVPPSPSPPATPCPAVWSCADVGNPALVGDQSLATGSWAIQGAGTDISSYSDQFHFVWQSLTNNGTISARVATQANTSGTAKAGVMLRQSTNAGAAYYGAFVTAANGIVVQDRTAQGQHTDVVGSLAGACAQRLGRPRWRWYGRDGTGRQACR